MITISNETDGIYRFKLADDRVYSISFEARTPANRLLDLSDAYKVAMSLVQARLLPRAGDQARRGILVQGGTRALRRVDAAGNYTVKAAFYPELVALRGRAPYRLNVLSLSVRPSPGLPPASESIQAVTGEALKAQALPPDEVVRRTIVARQKELWNEFFLYMDLEALLSRDQDRKKEYDAASDEGRSHDARALSGRPAKGTSSTTTSSSSPTISRYSRLATPMRGAS